MSRRRLSLVVFMTAALAAGQDRPLIELRSDAVNPSPWGATYYERVLLPLDHRILNESSNRRLFRGDGFVTHPERKTDRPGSVVPFMSLAPVTTEVEARRNFANDVFRWRTDRMLRAFLVPQGRIVRQFRKVQQSLASLQHNSTRFAPAGIHMALHYGYDVLADFARVELEIEDMSVGFFHAAFATALFGHRPGDRPVFFQAAWHRAKFFSPCVRYRLDNGSLEAALSRQLTPRMALSAGLTTSLRPGGGASGMGVTVTQSL